jgi:hypothetical protein
MCGASHAAKFIMPSGRAMNRFHLRLHWPRRAKCALNRRRSDGFRRRITERLEDPARTAGLFAEQFLECGLQRLNPVVTSQTVAVHAVEKCRHINDPRAGIYELQINQRSGGHG